MREEVIVIIPLELHIQLLISCILQIMLYMYHLTVGVIILLTGIHGIHYIMIHIMDIIFMHKIIIQNVIIIVLKMHMNIMVLIERHLLR